MLPNSKIFRYFLVFFIGGVFAGSFWQASGLAVWLLFIFSIAILAFDFKSRKNYFLFFCFLGFLLGLARTNKAVEKIGDYKNGEFQGTAKVIRESQAREDYSQLVIQDTETKDKFLVNASLYPVYEYGQLLNTRCQLVLPENKYPKFDYIRYLAKDGIYQICRGAELGQVDEKEASQIRNDKNHLEEIKTFYFSKVFLVKKSLENKIEQIFPSPESEYLAGLILGGSDRLPSEVAENFRRTGTTHTVAVSGYNITILAEFLMIFAIALGLWRPKAFWLAVVGIVFFVMMIGFPASAVRAAIMGVLLLWASKHGRLANSITAILLAGAVMVSFSPLILLHDAGFQLSFLATLGIVLVYGPLSEKFEIKKDFLELKSILLVTIAAQLGVMGVLLYTFETFSPISLLANLLILPAVPYIMFSGFFVSLVGYISMPLAKIFSIPVWLALKTEISVIGYLARFSWSLIDIKGLNWAFVAIYYVFFIFLVVKLKHPTNLQIKSQIHK